MDENPIKWILLAAGGIIVLVFIFMAFPFTMVGAGQRGVVMNYGKVSDTILDEGLHFRLPFVQSIQKVNVRVQKNEVKAEAASKDLQDVNMDVVVNYHINPTKVNKVYQQIGNNEEVYQNIIAPNTNEVVKAATSGFTAEEIVKRRQELKDKIDRSLAERLITYNVVLDDVSLTNVDFSREFNNAIEAKQVAEQEALKAKFTADQAIQEANARVNKAKGEAEAQKLQLQSLTPELLQKMAIERWDGHYPTYYSGSDLPLITIQK